jgi:hypothetical protein
MNFKSACQQVSFHFLFFVAMALHRRKDPLAPCEGPNKWRARTTAAYVVGRLRFHLPTHRCWELAVKGVERVHHFYGDRSKSGAGTRAAPIDNYRIPPPAVALLFAIHAYYKNVDRFGFFLFDDVHFSIQDMDAQYARITVQVRRQNMPIHPLTQFHVPVHQLVAWLLKVEQPPSPKAPAFGRQRRGRRSPSPALRPHL